MQIILKGASTIMFDDKMLFDAHISIHETSKIYKKRQSFRRQSLTALFPRRGLAIDRDSTSVHYIFTVLFKLVSNVGHLSSQVK